MASSLQDDLLFDFKEQKTLIEQQLEVFDPLGTELSKPAARRLVSKTALIIAEILCYCLAAGAVTFAVLMTRFPPFDILPEIRFNPDVVELGWQRLEWFNIAIYGLLGVITILFYIIARCMRSIRLKNDILHYAGKNIKIMVGQHLKRKASLQTTYERHFNELPPLPHEMTVQTVRVNEVVNPGFEG